MLLPGIAGLSLIITVLLYAIGFSSYVWLSPFLFVGCFVCLLLCWALPCVVYALFVDLDKVCTKDSRFFRFYANCIASSIRQIFRVKVHVTGMERLPKEKFLLVGNHRSFMDPILEMELFRRSRIGFVAKQELFKIPVVRKIMHKCFCLSLDRSNPRDGIRAIIQAAEIIKSQTASIGIYPEGTRSKGDEFLPFKAGAFKIAQKAKCPIVVTVIQNSEQAAKSVFFKRKTVFVDVIGVISAAEVAECKTTQLSDRARKMMEAALSAKGRGTL